jgi:drug/metabolite transporter (DMT)-like permease
MEIVFALGSAIAYGVADFVGGVLTKRAHVFSVILLSQVVSSAILILVLPFWDEGFSWPAIGWGAAAGVAGMSGAALLYRGLAVGRMGVVAPITAVLAAGIPVAVGLVGGERPGPVALFGVILGIGAVVLISGATAQEEVEPARQEPRHAELGSESGVVEGLGAGVCFGLFFILLERAPGNSGIWPLAGVRLSMVACVLVLAFMAGAALRPAPGVGQSVVWLGSTNLAADLLFLLATRAGLLSLVAVITSLYPAATVALARVVLTERLSRQQWVGAGCAALSVSLIALR